MIVGVDMAMSELTLVLFTTLAPSGTLAFLLMGVMSYIGRIDSETRSRIDRHLYVPLVVALVGLVMSATHLGNPSNVLYVFARTGYSPLSNEVASAALFLALAGVYWLHSFSRKPALRLRAIWFALICIAGIVFITLIAFAYAADTIVSWNTPYVPTNLWLSAVVGGPILALASLRLARAEFVRGKIARIFLIESFIALIANVACMSFQNEALKEVSNELSTAIDLVPFYGVCIVAFALLTAISIAMQWMLDVRDGAFEGAYRRKRMGHDSNALHESDIVALQEFGFEDQEAGSNQRRADCVSRRAFIASVIACILVFTGIFLTRFAFYSMHLTIGLGM